ncbi:TCP-1/cpn60 chaperonin [Gracilaria domingensis]|nr:TCP-1/cpn60 chaperonin [Gracilaria domingensis]
MIGSREQLAIAEFAGALLVIPKALAMNAAHDSTDLVAKRKALHHAAQNEDSKAKLSSFGLDLDAGSLRDNLSESVVEPVVSKKKIIQFATEAALPIIRIDDSVKIDKEEDDRSVPY